MTPSERKERPSWYRDAIIYELHVRAFHDSDGDGIGDFPGLTEKLDYLRDLGITAIWLLPFYPSPLKDDGYDVSDYRGVHPDYGTVDQFHTFLNQAHQKDLRVITELVINHTSDQHPWFQRAREAVPGSRWRDFYVWSEDPERFSEARVIFQDYESSNWSWDPVAQSYYWHRFYEHQPDLNFQNPEVRESIKDVVDYWLEMGVDGLRLDAVPYLYEREGTYCENLPETHEFLKTLRSHVDENFDDRMLLAEANQWPEDAVEYFGDGDEAHMAFHFPLMPRLFMGVQLEDRFPIVDIVEQTPEIPEECQWAIFLRNHDELTLEMVTDEEREYMYQSYAQDPQAQLNLGIRHRLAPLLKNNRRKIELMNSLLLSLPGTPVIYYGDEIGMGDNIYLGDRSGVRTPMQWSPDRNAGFSDTNPQRLYLPVIMDPEYHYEAVNVEAQQNNPSSLLAWMKRLINLRKQYEAFSTGDLRFIYPDNYKVLAYTRETDDEILLIVANLSRFTQSVELDLADYRGLVPKELFGQSEFPPVGEEPYFLTLAPHTFYWFALESPVTDETSTDRTDLHRLHLHEEPSTFAQLLHGERGKLFEEAIGDYLSRARWFSGKARQFTSVTIIRHFSLWESPRLTALLLVEVGYKEAPSEVYAVPVTEAYGSGAEEILEERPETALTRIHVEEEEESGVIFDAVYDEEFRARLLAQIAGESAVDQSGNLTVSATAAGEQSLPEAGRIESSRVHSGEQTNTSIVYDQELIFKFFRKLEPGPNPDLEIGQFLTENHFEHSPAVLASVHCPLDSDRRGRTATLGILHEYVSNEGDAWEYTLDSLDRYFDSILAESPQWRSSVQVPDGHLLDLAQTEKPPRVIEVIGPYIHSAELLGRRTAELHLALSSEGRDEDFGPSSLTSTQRRSIYQSIRSTVRQTFRLLDNQLDTIDENQRLSIESLLDREAELLSDLRTWVLNRLSRPPLIRCHGDYHLGQVLYTGKDFVIIDFEGEPDRPLNVRRLKRPPLRDLAGMVRSFHYAAYSALFQKEATEEPRTLKSWATYWYKWISASFLEAYMETAEGEDLLPADSSEREALLNAFLLEKAVYELGYEINNRPDWLRVPLKGIEQLL